MARQLLIVESPTKAKTLKKYMGRGYDVRASVGHIIDLPKSKLGVDVKKNFAPTYQVIKGKDQVLEELTAAAKEADRILLATDPDREGEAIAWHIAAQFKDLGKPIERVEFHEITKKAVLEAVNHPRPLNQDLFESQQARRILDRLVGYKISPILWTKVRRGLSAGRVQSVAVRLIVDREREIRAFVPEEYWSLAAELDCGKPPLVLGNLFRVDGEKVEIKNKDQAGALVKSLESAAYRVAKVEKKERRRNPSPPFTTSAIQQEASRKLRFPAKKTMLLAQRLYEGVDLGEVEGTVGLITYMRTDSVRLADEAVAAARAYIEEKHGKNYLPAQPNVYKSRKGAQEAHEAIRPTSTQYTPEKVKAFLERDALRLYQLIWQRYLSSQMAPAVYDQTSVDIEATPKAAKPPSPQKIILRATGSVLKFDGFAAVYLEGHDEGETVEEGEEGDRKLPALTEGQEMKLHKLLPEQHFTQPPPRYTDASMVKGLEEKGIGRPSTYAAILSNIQDKKYVTKEDARYFPTEMGIMVTDLLVEHFPKVLDLEFTAQMEDELDEVAEGKLKWVQALKDFYGPFSENLKLAETHMKEIKRQVVETEFLCEKCGSKMNLKFGRFGEFLACSKYPDCKGTMNIKRLTNGTFEPIKASDLSEPYPGACEKCNSPLTLRKAWTGSRYIACQKYKDECTFTKPFPVGVKCPDCGSDIVERASKRKKVFYGCGGYPNCKHVVWYPPVNEPCPKCRHPFLVDRVTKRKGHYHACPKKECGYEKPLEDAPVPEETAEPAAAAG